MPFKERRVYSPTVFALNPKHHILLADLTCLRQPGLRGKPTQARETPFSHSLRAGWKYWWGYYQLGDFIDKSKPDCWVVTAVKSVSRIYLCVTARPMSLLTACGELRCTATLSTKTRTEDKEEGKEEGSMGGTRKIKKSPQTLESNEVALLIHHMKDKTEHSII